MNRPEALNALDKQVLEDLNTVLDQVESDPDILVAIVRCRRPWPAHSRPPGRSR